MHCDAFWHFVGTFWPKKITRDGCFLLSSDAVFRGESASKSVRTAKCYPGSKTLLFSAPQHYSHGALG